MNAQGGSQVASGKQPKGPVWCGITACQHPHLASAGLEVRQELCQFAGGQTDTAELAPKLTPKPSLGFRCIQNMQKCTDRARPQNSLVSYLRDLSMSGKPNVCTACFRASASAISRQAATGTSCRWKCLFWVYLSCNAGSKPLRQPQRCCAAGSTISGCSCPADDESLHV